MVIGKYIDILSNIGWSNFYENFFSLSFKGYLFGTSFLLNTLNFSIFNTKTIEYSSRMRDLEKLTGEDQHNVVGKLTTDSKIENDPVFKF